LDTDEVAVKSSRWNKEQLKLAFNLYCQLPFGKLHSRNAEVVELAQLIGRTPSAVAMKLVNFASLDPAITASGRVGLGNASALDREVWEEFHADWERLALECAALNLHLRPTLPIETMPETFDAFDLKDFTGETRRVITEQRMRQQFFRRAVLASYGERCCMSGLSDARLLMASHIVPWSMDKANRLNPSNGLCLSALHDKAFDQGLITITDDFRVMVSGQLRDLTDGSALKSVLTALQDQPIEKPERFLPHVDFLARHRSEIYVG
jgi:predicted restriction endonuclease